MMEGKRNITDERCIMLLDGKEIEITISDKAQKELDEIEKKINKSMQPLYDELGVDMETESLYWMNNEVYVINKKTGERREIGESQEELNKKMFNNAIELTRCDNL